VVMPSEKNKSPIVDIATSKAYGLSHHLLTY